MLCFCLLPTGNIKAAYCQKLASRSNLLIRDIIEESAIQKTCLVVVVVKNNIYLSVLQNGLGYQLAPKKVANFFPLINFLVKIISLKFRKDKTGRDQFSKVVAGYVRFGI